MQMHISEARKRRETKTKTYKKLTKEKSAIKRGNKPQAPLSSKQMCLLKWFGEDICGLPLWRDMDQVYVSFLMVVSQEMESDICVFGSGV